MRRLFLIGLFCMAMFALEAVAQTTPTSQSVDSVLDALHDCGQNVHSFTADLKRNEDNGDMGTVDRFGKVWYQVQPDGDVIFHVLMDHSQIGKHTNHDKIEYQVEGGWLTALDYSRALENRTQLTKPGEKANLFQLGEGQFPLPIGQDKKNVHELFDVVLSPPAKDDPANTVHLVFTPKPNTQFADAYASIEVWVDQATHMPVRIGTTNKRQTLFTTNDLLNMTINPVLKKEDLSVPPLDKSWKYSERPLAE